MNDQTGACSKVSVGGTPQLWVRIVTIIHECGCNGVIGFLIQGSGGITMLR